MKGNYELIVIGGSLGGMEAISSLLSILPADYALPIIIVLHRLKNVKSPLIELLSLKTRLKVKEADEKEKLEPGVAYIAPANYHLLVESDKTLSLCISEVVNYSRPSLDVIFESVASVYKDKVIGILLTGANEDGGEGLKSITLAGGLTVVQDPSTATSPVMPMAAIKRFKPDYILDIEGIKQFLLKVNNDARQI